MKSDKTFASMNHTIMKTIHQIGRLILCLICVNAALTAHAKDWKSASLDDGKIAVQYNISKRTDKNGKKVPLIEYRATTTENLSLGTCLTLMKDVAQHMQFTGDDFSETILTPSANVWVIYYFKKGGGPLSDSDSVVKMTLTEDAEAKTAVFTQTAAPALLEDKNVKRMTYYDVTYTFKAIGNAQVEITMTAHMSPPMKVPLWMINMAFPDAAGKTLRKFVELARKQG